MSKSGVTEAIFFPGRNSCVTKMYTYIEKAGYTVAIFSPPTGSSLRMYRNADYDLRAKPAPTGLGSHPFETVTALRPKHPVDRVGDTGTRHSNGIDAFVVSDN